MYYGGCGTEVFFPEGKMLSKAWKHLTINLCRKKLVPLHVELRSRSFFSTSHLLLAQRKIHKQSLWNCWQTGNVSDPIAVLIGQVINHAFNSVLVIWFQHIYKTPKLNSIQDQQATASKYTVGPKNDKNWTGYLCNVANLQKYCIP